MWHFVSRGSLWSNHSPKEFMIVSKVSVAVAELVERRLSHVEGGEWESESSQRSDLWKLILVAS